MTGQHNLLTISNKIAEVSKTNERVIIPTVQHGWRFSRQTQRQPDGHVSNTTECRQTSEILNGFCAVSRTFVRCKSLSASDDSRPPAAICKPPTAIRLIAFRCGILCAKRRRCLLEALSPINHAPRVRHMSFADQSPSGRRFEMSIISVLPGN